MSMKNLSVSDSADQQNPTQVVSCRGAISSFIPSAKTPSTEMILIRYKDSFIHSFIHTRDVKRKIEKAAVA